jgi:hypothetical protein
MAAIPSLSPSGELIEHLDGDRKRDGEVEVPARNVKVQAIGDQRHTDQQQEAERQHLHRRMLLNEAADRLRRQQHDGNRDHHRGDHHPHVLRHADGGDDGIEGEHDVQQDDLDDRGEERGVAALLGRLVTAALGHVVDLHRPLDQQEQPADGENEITPGNDVLAEGEKRLGQTDDPGDRQQQGDAHAGREAETDGARPRLLCRRQPVGDDRQEHDVVDAEHDFQGRQRQQAGPCIGLAKKKQNFIHPRTPNPAAAVAGSVRAGRRAGNALPSAGGRVARHEPLTPLGSALVSAPAM